MEEFALPRTTSVKLRAMHTRGIIRSVEVDGLSDPAEIAAANGNLPVELVEEFLVVNGMVGTEVEEEEEAEAPAPAPKKKAPARKAAEAT